MPDTDLNHEFEQRAQRIAERCEPYAKPVGQVAFEIEEALHEAYLAGVKSASVLSAVGSSSPHEGEQEQHPATLGSGDAMDWISAAKRLGELLAPDGPDGYYRFTPQQWFDWAKTKVSSSAAPREGEQEPRCECGAKLTQCTDCAVGDWQAAHPDCIHCAFPPPLAAPSLRGLIEKWRTLAAYSEVRGGMTLKECADELAALLSGKGK